MESSRLLTWIGRAALGALLVAGVAPAPAAAQDLPQILERALGRDEGRRDDRQFRDDRERRRWEADRDARERDRDRYEDRRRREDDRRREADRRRREDDERRRRADRRRDDGDRGRGRDGGAGIVIQRDR